MLFWVICVAMALLVLTVVVRPLLQDQAAPQAAPDVEIYRAQLAEIDRDLARDLLAPDEAERARTEVARRLLAADGTTVTTHDAPVRLTRIGAGVMAVGVIGIALWSYVGIGAPGEPDQPLSLRLANAETLRETRPDQAALEAAAPLPQPIEVPDEYLESVRQLRTLMATRPDELEGWELLAFHEAELRQFAAAAAAQSRVVAIKAADATVDDKRILLDLMVAATDGFVSPEAEVIAREILDADSDNIPARYYLGSLFGQTGRPDIAFRLWRPLVDSGEDTFHTTLARAQIEAVAEMSGIKYTAPALVGPSLEDIEAAEDMAPEDRTAMIANMVAGLADRLANEGGGPPEWARLITAYGVLGDTENAAIVWTEAADVFGADENAMALLRDAARSAGVLE